ncbi:hypothetical protein LOZ66_006857 [Ophidiomyces ophidiicola]|nr:hypothetical protein LOZ66_006857 [Ophidiomyces ophidiicola]
MLTSTSSLEQSQEIMVYSQEDVESALEILSQTPIDVLETVRARVLATILTVRKRLKVEAEEVADLLDSFQRKSKAIEEVAKKPLEAVVDFTHHEADIRFSHANAVRSGGGQDEQTVCRALCAYRSLGLEFEGYMVEQHGRSRVEKLAGNRNGSEGRTDSRVPEFLQHKQYGTGWRGKRAISFGIKLLVAEKMFGSAGISLYAMFVMAKFRAFRYRPLFDVVEALSSGSGVHGELGEKIKRHGPLVLRTQQFYNGGFRQMSCTMAVNLWLLQQVGKVDELRNALGLGAMALPVAVDDRTVDASDSRGDHATRCPKSNEPTGTVRGAPQTWTRRPDEGPTPNRHQQSPASGPHPAGRRHPTNHDDPPLGGQDACDSINERSNGPTSIPPGNGPQLPPIASFATFGTPRGGNQNVVPGMLDNTRSSSRFCGGSATSHLAARPHSNSWPMATQCSLPASTPGVLTSTWATVNPPPNDGAFSALGQVNISSELPPLADNITSGYGSGNGPTAFDPNDIPVFSAHHGTSTTNSHSYRAATLNETSSRSAGPVENDPNLPTGRRPATHESDRDQTNTPAATLQGHASWPPLGGLNAFSTSRGMVDSTLEGSSSISHPVPKYSLSDVQAYTPGQRREAYPQPTSPPLLLTVPHTDVDLESEIFLSYNANSDIAPNNFPCSVGLNMAHNDVDVESAMLFSYNEDSGLAPSAIFPYNSGLGMARSDVDIESGMFILYNQNSRAAYTDTNVELGI